MEQDQSRSRGGGFDKTGGFLIHPHCSGTVLLLPQGQKARCEEPVKCCGIMGGGGSIIKHHPPHMEICPTPVRRSQRGAGLTFSSSLVAFAGFLPASLTLDSFMSTLFHILAARSSNRKWNSTGKTSLSKLLGGNWRPLGGAAQQRAGILV